MLHFVGGMERKNKERYALTFLCFVSARYVALEKASNLVVEDILIRLGISV